MISREKKIKIFASNSVKTLAENVSDRLGLEISNMTVKKYSDGEIFVDIGESVQNCTCLIFQSTCPPVNDNLMELLIIADALKRDGAKKIVAVIPYFGYSRQDRKARSHDPITAKLVTNLITTSGICEIVTIDLHTSQLEGFFDIPVLHLHGQEILANYIKNSLSINNDFVVVSPDLGSINRAKKFAVFLDNLPIVIVNKNRKKPNECEITDIIGDVKNKKAIIIDDMIDTAGTLCNVADFLYKNGATDVFACATHGILSGKALERINSSQINKLFLLDTIPLDDSKTNKKITAISTEKLLSKALEEIIF